MWVIQIPIGNADQPFAGAVIAILLLGEKPHLGQLWGGLAIATGLVLGLRQVNGKQTA